MKQKRPKQEFYALANLDTGEIKFFPSLVAISIYLGKCKSWASYIVREKDGKYKNYQIMKGDGGLNVEGQQLKTKGGNSSTNTPLLGNENLS